MKKIVLILLAVLAIVTVGSSYDKKQSVVFFQQGFLNQTGDMASVTILPAGAEMDCFVNLYVENQTDRNIGLGVIVDWSDNLGSMEAGINSLSPTTFPIHIAATSPITVHVHDSTGVQHYNMYASGQCQ